MMHRPTQRVLASCLIALVCAGRSAGQTAPLQAPAIPIVPEQFRPLFESLDQTLTQARQTYPIDRSRPLPLTAPSLLLASSIYGPAPADSQRWKDLLATLDTYQSMGMQAVLVQIMAPDLAYGETQSYIDFYQRLAAEIHSRNLKLYIEHFVNVPFKTNQPRDGGATLTFRDDPQGRQEFLKILQQELVQIDREIKPDYLSLLTEPQSTINDQLHFTFEPDELTAWVGQTAKLLRSGGASPATLLGAGATTIEPDDFIMKFAQQPDLDYINFHLYVVKYKGEDQIAKVAAMIHRIREVRPAMKFTIGETWLCKVGKEGPAGTIQEAFFRDNFSFWAPLDEQFMAVLMGMAQKEEIAVIAPYFSQHFFAYYTFGSPEAGALPPWPKCVGVSWNKAIEAIHRHELTPTGQAVADLLKNNTK
jgi:hypothetical protein